MTEVEKKNVQRFSNDTYEWAQKLSHEFNIRLSCEDLLFAMVIENKRDLVDIASEHWTYNQCKEWFEKSALIKTTPKIAGAVYIENTIIPEGTYRTFLEEQVKFKGEKWIIHKNDADPFPSSPHAHNYEARLKLHMGNGDLYHGTDKVGTVKRKDFINLRNSFKNIAMPPLEV